MSVVSEESAQSLHQKENSLGKNGSHLFMQMQILNQNKVPQTSALKLLKKIVKKRPTSRYKEPMIKSTSQKNEDEVSELPKATGQILSRMRKSHIN